MKKVLYSLILLFINLNCFSQIQTNEKLVYAASYNMGGMMTHLAEVTMSTEIVNTSKKNYLHLSWEAATFSKWDSFFKIRDLYETYVNPTTLKPSLYKRNIYEGGYTKAEQYVFKNDGRTVIGTTKKKNRPESKNTFTVGNSTQDIISMVYRLRVLDFNSFKPGQAKLFVIVFDQKEFPVTIKYMGKESVSGGILGTNVCYKLSIGAQTNALRGKDKNLIWLTADTKKIPVLVKFSIPVGTGQLKLVQATGI